MADIPPFIQVERSFIRYAQKHLTKSDMLVYIAICRFSFDRYGKNYIVHPGYDAIAKEAGIDRRTVLRSCKKLIDHGWLRKVGFNSAKCVMWELVKQSPAGIREARAAAMEAALQDGGGGSTTPTETGVAAPPLSKSLSDHPQSRSPATLLRTPSEEQEETPVSTSQGGKPNPDAQLHDLSQSQRTILQVKRENGGVPLTDLILSAAARSAQLREAGVDLDQQREMSNYRAEQLDQEAEVRRLSGKHANGSTPAPIVVADDEVVVPADKVAGVIREGTRALA